MSHHYCLKGVLKEFFFLCFFFFFLFIKVSFRSWGNSSLGSLPGKCGDLNLVPCYACYCNCNSSSGEMGSRDETRHIPGAARPVGHLHSKVQASETLSQKDRRHQRTNIRDCPLTSMHQDTHMHPLQMNTQFFLDPVLARFGQHIAVIPLRRRCGTEAGESP